MREGWDESLPRVVGLLRAGLPAEEAWRRAGVTPPESPATAIDRAVAAAGHLARRTGAPLAAMLLTLARTAADEREAQALREAALAGPRLSARVLLWLPLVGIALGALVDVRTLRVLALTPVGWVLVALGAVLTWAGRAWTRRIVEGAAAAGGGTDAVVTGAALVAAALGAGSTVADALREVGQALDEPGLEALATPSAPVDPTWLPVARALAPAIDAGASPAASLEAVSAAAARRARTDSAVAAGEMGVRVALPLTLCLLPAFLAVGLAPLLVAVMGGAFAGVP